MDLDALPSPSTKRLAVRVTKDAQRQLRGGHPWVYADSITSSSHEAPAGDLAVVFDDDRRFLAIGLHDPTSPIRVRVLHQGGPRAIDAAFFGERIDAALARRGAIVADKRTTAYRCVHGENDDLPGVVIDRYEDVLVVKLDTPAWIPHLATVVPAAIERTFARTAVLRVSRHVRDHAASCGLADGDVLAGPPPPDPVAFLENGLRFDADVARGQKTGHFLDQRDNRARVRELAGGARVLDVFSCTGGFTVHAAAGGANAVDSVDLSPHAIEAVRHNIDANRDRPAVAACTVRGIVGDAFVVMERMLAARERYDLVVVDPPSFASKQADVARGLGAYARLTHLAVRLTGPGGILVQSSCSSRIPADAFHHGVEAAALEAGRPLEVLERTAHAIDHPVRFVHGAYLKTTFARVP